NTAIQEKLYKLEDIFIQKEQLAERFKRLNPALRNSIQYFSSLMAQIIESEAHLELIESCFEQEYQYQLIDKVRTLFLGILIYTNKPDEQQRQDMLALLKEIKEQPEKLN